MILAWVISGNPLIGIKIGAAEVVTKMLLYYLHERTWYKIDFGLQNRRKEEVKKDTDPRVSPVKNENFIDER